MRRTLPRSLAAFALTILVLTPAGALADGAITNGATHTGVIEIGGQDSWTFTAAKNDSITIAIGEIPGSGEDPDFYPWIRLHAPDGSNLDNGDGTTGDWGTNYAELDVRAPLAGTYTVVVTF
jgi:hypothetical protein